MPVAVAIWVDNALFFGAALVALFVVSNVLSRQTSRVIGYGLYAANKSDRAALQSILNLSLIHI